VVKLFIPPLDGLFGFVEPLPAIGPLPVGQHGGCRFGVSHSRGRHVGDVGKVTAMLLRVGQFFDPGPALLDKGMGEIEFLATSV
jgi:hypothetical protein